MCLYNIHVCIAEHGGRLSMGEDGEVIYMHVYSFVYYICVYEYVCVFVNFLNGGRVMEGEEGICICEYIRHTHTCFMEGGTRRGRRGIIYLCVCARARAHTHTYIGKSSSDKLSQNKLREKII